MSQRIATLPNGNKIPYLQYLQTKQWQRLRLLAHDRDQGCVVCQTPEDLHVHHRTYDRLGNEDLEDLVVLCKKHHLKVHQRHQKLMLKKGMSLAEATDTYIAIQHKNAARAAAREKVGTAKPRPNKAQRRAKKEHERRELKMGLVANYGHLLAEGNNDRRQRAHARLVK